MNKIMKAYDRFLMLALVIGLGIDDVLFAAILSGYNMPTSLKFWFLVILGIFVCFVFYFLLGLIYDVVAMFVQAIIRLVRRKKRQSWRLNSEKINQLNGLTNNN